jgi:hypothetical protein
VIDRKKVFGALMDVKMFWPKEVGYEALDIIKDAVEQALKLERADADTAGVRPGGNGYPDAMVIKSDPCACCGGCGCFACLKNNRASERADAEKDAAKERERFWCELRSIHDPDDLNKHEVELAWSMWQARAILAANKDEMNDELLRAVENLIQAADAYLEGYDEPAVVPFNTRRGSFGELREAYARAMERREKEK